MTKNKKKKRKSLSKRDRHEQLVIVDRGSKGLFYRISTSHEQDFDQILGGRKKINAQKKVIFAFIASAVLVSLLLWALLQLVSLFSSLPLQKNPSIALFFNNIKNFVEHIVVGIIALFSIFNSLLFFRRRL